MINASSGVAPGGYEIARVDDFDMPEHHNSYDAQACQNSQPVLFHRHPGQARGLGAADVVAAKSDTTVLLSRGGICKLKK